MAAASRHLRNANAMMPARAVFLAGFMGAGKTSVGEALARRWQCAFHDLDARIVARAGASIAEIFHNQGEAAFRELESEALRELLAGLQAPAVVALGGGTLLRRENVERLRAAGGTLVLLDAPVEVLYERTQAARGTRPLALDEAAFRRLYDQRRAAYAAAEVTVESGGSVDEVAERVERSLQGEKR